MAEDVVAASVARLSQAHGRLVSLQDNWRRLTAEDVRAMVGQVQHEMAEALSVLNNREVFEDGDHRH